MSEKIGATIEKLTVQSAEVNTTAIEALQFTQAALNLAHVGAMRDDTAGPTPVERQGRVKLHIVEVVKTEFGEDAVAFVKPIDEFNPSSGDEYDVHSVFSPSTKVILSETDPARCGLLELGLEFFVVYPLPKS